MSPFNVICVCAVHPFSFSGSVCTPTPRNKRGTGTCVVGKGPYCPQHLSRREVTVLNECSVPRTPMSLAIFFLLEGVSRPEDSCVYSAYLVVEIFISFLLFYRCSSSPGLTQMDALAIADSSLSVGCDPAPRSAVPVHFAYAVCVKSRFPVAAGATGAVNFCLCHVSDCRFLSEKLCRVFPVFAVGAAL